jgi:hypothetical protein
MPLSGQVPCGSVAPEKKLVVLKPLGMMQFPVQYPPTHPLASVTQIPLRQSVCSTHGSPVSAPVVGTVPLVQ